MRSSFIVSVKALGDFVIACNCLRRVSSVPRGRARPALLAGEHLNELAHALGVEDGVRFLSSGGKYPDAYDMRRKGIRSALKSLIALRNTFRSLPAGCELIFDRLGWREYLLGAGFNRVGFTDAPNVYLALLETLRSAGFDVSVEVGQHGANSFLRGLAMIFPSSRVASKCLPPHVLARVIRSLAEAGLTCEVAALDGEGLQLPPDAPVRCIERSFKALIRTILESDFVVSADSLPAHLAEYLGVPTYVVSPVANRYWLPLSSYTSHGWCLFEEDDALRSWLHP